MIFTKEDASSSDKQVKLISREYNIHYRACVGSFVYILSTRVDLCFAVHNLENVSSNPGRVQFKGLINLLRYIRDNKNLVLIYYANIYDTPLSNLLRQAITNTEKLVMLLSDSRW